MPKVTINLYKYAELSEKSQEKARDWYRNGSDHSDRLSEMFANDLPNFGFSRVHGIQFRLSYSQGDGVSFLSDGVDMAELREAWDQKNVGDIREKLPEYADLFEAHDRLTALGEDVTSMRITDGGRNYYSHEFTVRADIAFTREPLGQYVGPNRLWIGNDPKEDALSAAQEAFDHAFTELFRAVMVELKHNGYAEIEYQDSDEQVSEAIEANEYLFVKNGERAEHWMEELLEGDLSHNVAEPEDDGCKKCGRLDPPRIGDRYCTNCDERKGK